MRRVEFEKRLKEAGFDLARQGKHRVWEKPDGTRISVPQGQKIEGRLSKLLTLQLKRGTRLYNQVT